MCFTSSRITGNLHLSEYTVEQTVIKVIKESNAELDVKFIIKVSSHFIEGSHSMHYKTDM